MSLRGKVQAENSEEPGPPVRRSGRISYLNLNTEPEENSEEEDDQNSEEEENSEEDEEDSYDDEENSEEEEEDSYDDEENSEEDEQDIVEDKEDIEEPGHPVRRSSRISKLNINFNMESEDVSGEEQQKSDEEHESEEDSEEEHESEEEENSEEEDESEEEQDSDEDEEEEDSEERGQPMLRRSRRISNLVGSGSSTIEEWEKIEVARKELNEEREQIIRMKDDEWMKIEAAKKELREEKEKMSKRKIKDVKEVIIIEDSPKKRKFAQDSINEDKKEETSQKNKKNAAQKFRFN